MKKIRHFFFLIILASPFLLVPQICDANGGVSFFFGNDLLLFIVAFLGVWGIEIAIINKKIPNKPKRAFLATLLANTVTTIFGFVFIFKNNGVTGTVLNFFGFLGDILGFLATVLFFFLTTVVIEIIVLSLFYRNEKLIKLFLGCSLANLISYVFLILLLIFGATNETSAIFMVSVIIFFSVGSFRILSAGKIIPNTKRTIMTVLIFILSLFVCGFIINRVDWKGTHSLARDAQRKSEIRQVVTAQEIYHNENNAYFISGAVAGATTTVPAITSYLNAIAITITEPISGSEYIWNHNADNINGCIKGEFFCACAVLDNKGSCNNIKYFCASEKGTKEICDVMPTYTSDDCVCW